jgi:glutamate dehydrogenase
MTNTDTRVELETLAKALAGKEAGLSHLIAHVIAATDPEDFAQVSVETLEASLRRAHAAILHRAPGKPLIAIAETSAGTVIDVICQDMPFIVDSVLGAIRARGGVIRFITHPVVPVTGSAKGLEIGAEPEAGGRLDSFLKVFIAPLADIAGLQAELDAVLTDVQRAVADWQSMLARLREATAALAQTKARFPAPALAEARHFLDWLGDHNFTFLGMREYQITGEGKTAELTPVKKSGLGILADESFKFLRSGPDFVEMTPQHVAFLRDKDPLMVTKANVRARVHRRSHMDYVGIKLFDEAGALSGELRVVGLFTSMSLATPNTDVPLIRRKIADVMARSREDPQGHAGKALMSALLGYPRDELFQIGVDQLFDFATTIASLADRPRVRVLPRIDRFDNFVSALVYVPRDRYTSDIRSAIGDHLALRYDGRVSAYYPNFLEGDLVRVHFIIGRNGGATPRPKIEKLEAEITALTRSFGELLVEAAGEAGAVADYREAFSPSYQSNTSASEALADIGIFRALNAESDSAVRFGKRVGGDGVLGLKVFHWKNPIPLSDRVPILENFGFRVIDERTYTIRPADGDEHYLHDMVLSLPGMEGLKVDEIAPRLEAALLAVWSGQAESDGFNQLTLRAGLDWTEIAILRAYMRYLRQIGIPYSRAYLATVLAGQPDAAKALIALFDALLDPAFAGARDKAADTARAAISKALDKTGSLDEERIVKRLHNLVESTLRTNAFQRLADGSRPAALSFKFDCAEVDELPQPRPYREIFVYSPRVEGVHLRFGAIARGGLRWSDRPDDFRTEVLGLVKAQQVKNAVIVPVGAKGGFVPRLTPLGADRETVQREGVACYKIFVSTLLELTDNLDGDVIVPPEGVLRRDGDDPYLVVAADKGTATFSDTANAIAIEKNFWLGDAFASGGSVGYDHKKMAITARGAWEAVKRHFRELDRDIQKDPFTVVGVGDMSGDVFGNGMLLSKAIKLVAAFDHRDIFIDPNPDATKSFAERARLFALPRSSWQDYDTKLISRGGGIFSRSAKSVPLSEETRLALGLKGATATPQEVMTAILKADVDLLWFGGIGTYIRASGETDAEAGDRANDAIRITGADIRAKVVGEGANLAMTQRGRVQYALAGGRLNTDAIDNSAGVNSSDLEVNIKIALGSLMRAGTMTLEERNAFLPTMTPEVAALCLQNNYLQTLALSMTQKRGMAEFPDHVSLIETLEKKGLLSRAVEFLPSPPALAERAAAGQPLTRPELSVLLAYAKNTLYADLLKSSVPDDPYLGKELFFYFPETLAKTYPETIENHRLRREVIATVLANAMINRGGPAFVEELTAATSADAGQVAYAFAAARDIYGLVELGAAINGLDGQMSGMTQLALYEEVEALLVRETLWFLRNTSQSEGLSALVGRYRKGIDEVRDTLGDLMPQYFVSAIAEAAARFEKGGTPRDIAKTVAQLPVMGLATDIVLVSERSKVSVASSAAAFFGVLETFNLGAIIEQASRIVLSDRFDRMALDRALANLMRAQRDLAVDVLTAGSGPIAGRQNKWKASQNDAVNRAIGAVASLTEGELTVSRLSVAAGLLSDLARGA